MLLKDHKIDFLRAGLQLSVVAILLGALGLNSCARCQPEKALEKALKEARDPNFLRERELQQNCKTSNCSEDKILDAIAQIQDKHPYPDPTLPRLIGTIQGESANLSKNELRQLDRLFPWFATLRKSAESRMPPSCQVTEGDLVKDLKPPAKDDNAANARMSVAKFYAARLRPGCLAAQQLELAAKKKEFNAICGELQALGRKLSEEERQRLRKISQTEFCPDPPSQAIPEGEPIPSANPEIYGKGPNTLAPGSMGLKGLEEEQPQKKKDK